MTILINILQSMISRNKAEIRCRELLLLEAKENLKDRIETYKEKKVRFHNDTYYSVYLPDYLYEVKVSKKYVTDSERHLKALVTIQKALKKEVAEQLSSKRVRLTLEQLNNMIKDVS